MNWLTHCTLYLFLLSAVNSGGSQDLHFKNHPLFNLKQETTTFFISSKNENGFIWIASDEGLLKYDGVDYQAYSIPIDSIFTKVTSIYEDFNGTVWAGMGDGEVYFLNELDKFEKWLPFDGVTQSSITGFSYISEGNIWISTYGDGIYVWNQERLARFGLEDGLLGLESYQIVNDRFGRIWAATDAGISICEFDSTKKVKNLTREDGLPDEIIKYIFPNDKGLVWVATHDGGICSVDENSFEIKKTFSDWSLGQINCLVQVDERELWIGTEQNGLWRYIFKSGELVKGIRDNLNSLKIHQIYCDKEGNVWMLANNNLLVSVNSRFVVHNLGFMNIQAILKANQKDIWIGTQSGLFLLDDSEKLKKPASLVNENILCLYQDSFKNIWAGTFGSGIYIFDSLGSKTRRLTTLDGLSNESILSIDGTGDEIWIATLGGIIELDGSVNHLTSRTINFSNPNANNIFGRGFIYKIFVDSKNRCWVGTDGKGIGLIYEDSVKSFLFAEKTPIKSVYSIVEDQNSNIWFSTAKQGVFKFDGSKFTNLDLQNGLINSNISDLSIDENNKLVIVHNDAITIFDQESKEFVYYDQIFGNEFTGINLNAVFNEPDGPIWIGSKDYLIAYHSLSKKMRSTPTLYINKIEVNQKIQNQNVDGSFYSKQNNVRFEYGALWFTDPASINFSYRLVGYDDLWIKSKDKKAFYFNLAPGTYSFQLNASSGPKFSVTPNYEYKFEIKSPFWRRIWFILLSLSLLICLVFLIIRTREKRIQRESKLKKEKVQSQLETLKSQINPHFLFNNFNTLITVIEENPNLAVEYVEDLSDFYRNILQYRTKDLIPLNEEIELINTYCRLLKKRYGNNFNLEVRVNGGKQLLIVPLTLQMLVENAIKHNVISKSNCLNIYINQTSNQYLEIKNNLKPKITKAKSTGFGIESIIKRYGLITDRKIHVTSSGEFFKVEVPLLNDNAI